MEEGRDVAYRVGKRSLMLGGMGGAFGVVLGMARNASVPFYSISMMTNYTMMGLVYFSIFELGGVVLPDRKNTLELHAGAGALTGALLVTPFAGVRKTIPGMFLFAGLGAAMYSVESAYDNYKVRAAERIRQEYNQMSDEKKN